MRHIVLGNQSLLVNIDKWLQVRDIYFPYVGQENHLLGHAHRIALMEDDKLTWVNEDSWEKKLSYLNETLVTNNHACNKEWQIDLTFNENVYCESNIFFRKITIKNNADVERKIRLFFHQDYHLYGDGVGDTAYYDPSKKAIVHYKRSVYFLLGLCSEHDCHDFSDYTVGEHVSPSWNLHKRAIAQGEVDSLIALDIVLPAKKSKTLTYYMAAGSTINEVHYLQDRFLKQGVKSHLEHTQMCQRGWLSRIKPGLSMLPKDLQVLYKRSLLIIKTQINPNGSIIAANDSDNREFNKDTYSYMWPRDGALVSIALIKAGYPYIAKEFFLFCKDVLYEEGCLLHKYNPDKTLGSSWHPWIVNGEYSLPIQEDETALVLHALNIYFEHTKDAKFVKDMYKPLIKPMGEFLQKYRYFNGLPKESYDLWEEKRGVFTFTTAATLAGLRAADRLGHVVREKKFCEVCIKGYGIIQNAMMEHLYNADQGYFRKSVSFESGEAVYDDTMDASAYGVVEFGIFPADDQHVVSTMEKMKAWLSVKTPVGGIARYYNDYYHRVSDDLNNVPGNPWFICTLWYAKWLIKKATKKSDLKEALDIIKWSASHMSETGILAEQLHPYSGEPLSVGPLTWSHAEFVDTITDYCDRLEKFQPKR